MYIADGASHRIRKVTNVAQTGISQISNLGTKIYVYPTPATASIQVSWAGNSQDASLVMTDMLDNTLKELKSNNTKVEIDISDLEAGVYFITLTSGTSRTTQKAVVR